MGAIVYGATYSVYTRIVRLSLEEKGIPYDLVPIDIFEKDSLPPHYVKRHPFGRIPAFEHDGFRLYETGAIVRYVDEAFPGPALQPMGAESRARMNQIIGICDSYVYRTFVWDVFVERVNKPQRGEPSDEGRIADALSAARTTLAAITALKAGSHWLAGDAITLADLYLAPMLDYFLMTADGRTLTQDHPEISAWWTRMVDRSSMLATGYTT